MKKPSMPEEESIIDAEVKSEDISIRDVRIDNSDTPRSQRKFRFGEWVACCTGYECVSQ